ISVLIRSLPMLPGTLLVVWLPLSSLNLRETSLCGVGTEDFAGSLSSAVTPLVGRDSVTPFVEVWFNCCFSICFLRLNSMKLLLAWLLSSEGGGQRHLPMRTVLARPKTSCPGETGGGGGGGGGGGKILMFGLPVGFVDRSLLLVVVVVVVIVDEDGVTTGGPKRGDIGGSG